MQGLNFKDFLEPGSKNMQVLWLIREKYLEILGSIIFYKKRIWTMIYAILYTNKSIEEIDIHITDLDLKNHLFDDNIIRKQI